MKVFLFFLTLTPLKIFSPMFAPELFFKFKRRLKEPSFTGIRQTVMPAPIVRHDRVSACSVAAEKARRPLPTRRPVSAPPLCSADFSASLARTCFIQVLAIDLARIRFMRSPRHFMAAEVMSHIFSDLKLFCFPSIAVFK